MEFKSERIAEIIRKVDGNHSMGAGALADAIMAELEKDRELSDLEIVHKALDISGRELGLGTGRRWWIYEKQFCTDTVASGNDTESLLTWAKQTIGVE